MAYFSEMTFKTSEGWYAAQLTYSESDELLNKFVWGPFDSEQQAEAEFDEE